jgi:tetratricopeptide (TPR) repeat protein
MTMPNSSALRAKAIQAVKDSDWKNAVLINQEILEQSPKNLEAMNRLGLAYLKLKKEKEASKVFRKVLKIDRSNIIANKHIKKLKNKEKTPDVIFNHKADFIEEPGKSKIISLHRLTCRSQLDELKVGQECFLQIKNRYISIVDDKQKHIGALPEDISFRLSKLISDGNQYSCVIYKIDEKQCCVQLKEAFRSAKNQQLQSFPSKKINNQFNLGEDIVLEKDIPLGIVSTDEDDEDQNRGLETVMKKIEGSDS